MFPFQRPRPGSAAAPGTRALTAGVVLLAALVFLQYGLRGGMTRDDAALLYAGQQLAEGVPPYRSAATLKGPVAQIVTGLGVEAARAAGQDEVPAVRLLFLAIAASTVALVARLGAEVLTSARTGLYAALVMVGSLGYARLAAAGPRYGTVMLLFLALGLLLTERGRWFPAGVAGSLACLTWQPAALLPAATLLLAAVQGRSRRALAAAAAGIAVPIALLSAWAAAEGIFREFALRVFLLNLPYLDREGTGLAAHLRAPVEAVRRGYGDWMLAAAVVASALLAGEALARRRGSPSWSSALREGRGWVVLLTFPAFLLWSFVDFQGYDDFFPLLPGVALACGALLDGCVAGAGRAVGGSGARSRAGAWLGAAVALCGLVGAVAIGRGSRESDLDKQERAAHEIARRYPDHRLVSIGDPAALVLLRRRNPNPFLFIASGSDTLIDRRTPGGFDAWLEGLRSGGPLVVLGGRMRGSRRDRLRRWLEAGFRREQIGPVRAFVEAAR